MKNDLERDTKFTHMGRPPAGLGTSVSHPVTRASTLLFDKAKDLYRNDVRGYGRHGAAVHDALADLFTELEGGIGTLLYSSGLAALTGPILSIVKPGDHVLLTDSTYGPTRHFCLTFLARMGIETTFYDPRIGAGIDALIRDNTALILLESPGSLTFEIQDVPAIAKVAKAKGVTTLIDNTWSAGLTLSPLSMGVDISIHAATKYFGGHSDVLYGAAIFADAAKFKRAQMTAKQLGNASSPDDAYQILRGFRTVLPRFRQQEATSLALAQWLMTRNEVQQVLHPAVTDHPDHEIWKRDFTGGGCIFSVIFKPLSEAEVLRFIDGLNLFGIGYSYGGFESLAIHCDPQLKRNCAKPLEGPLIRFACGLEAMTDLKDDIEQALAKVF
ncbi:cystathionine beta-lyase [Litorimonas cladophorae]|uniref:Cystathionine beta-lyase n=1 Tax=Litorimonas cladophorae TaxID=1220491 RepID=A0A918NC65_9PROT|nr:cystathionine beta-lyase [Litorimonas cladophorae]GGX59461.1 cystathionine beta-lyase [Litorimonas cladophorae]